MLLYVKTENYRCALYPNSLSGPFGLSGGYIELILPTSKRRSCKSRSQRLRYSSCRTKPSNSFNSLRKKTGSTKQAQQGLVVVVEPIRLV